MTLRQDHQLQSINAFATDKRDNALLLKSEGLAQNTKVVKSKLLGIDPDTKALLVRWVDSLPGGGNGAMTGAQIVEILEALIGDARLSHTALDDVVSGSHHIKYTDAEAVAAVASETNALDWLGL